MFYDLNQSSWTLNNKIQFVSSKWFLYFTDVHFLFLVPFLSNLTQVKWENCQHYLPKFQFIAENETSHKIKKVLFFVDTLGRTSIKIALPFYNRSSNCCLFCMELYLTKFSTKLQVWVDLALSILKSLTKKIEPGDQSPS